MWNAAASPPPHSNPVLARYNGLNQPYGLVFYWRPEEGNPGQAHWRSLDDDERVGPHSIMGMMWKEIEAQVDSSHNVLQPWCSCLSMMQQSVLIAAVRGPDGIRKDHVAKVFCRWLRRSFLLSAFDKRALLDPYEPGGGNFTGPCAVIHPMYDFGNAPRDGIGTDKNGRHSIDAALDDYFRYVDEIPHHFQLHLMHAAEILGYKHPVTEIRNWWWKCYTRMANDMHLNVETAEQMDRRLGDNEKTWREAEEVTAANTGGTARDPGEGPVFVTDVTADKLGETHESWYGIEVSHHRWLQVIGDETEFRFVANAKNATMYVNRVDAHVALERMRERIKQAGGGSHPIYKRPRMKIHRLFAISIESVDVPKDRRWLRRNLQAVEFVTDPTLATCWFDEAECEKFLQTSLRNKIFPNEYMASNYTAAVREADQKAVDTHVRNQGGKLTAVGKCITMLESSRQPFQVGEHVFATFCVGSGENEQWYAERLGVVDGYAGQVVSIKLKDPLPNLPRIFAKEENLRRPDQPGMSDMQKVAIEAGGLEGLRRVSELQTLDDGEKDAFRKLTVLLNREKDRAGILSRGEFYAVIRMLEVFAPADPFITELQTKLGKLCSCIHPGNEAIGMEMAEKVARIENMHDLYRQISNVPGGTVLGHGVRIGLYPQFIRFEIGAAKEDHARVLRWWNHLASDPRDGPSSAPASDVMGRLFEIPDKQWTDAPDLGAVDSRGAWATGWKAGAEWMKSRIAGFATGGVVPGPAMPWIEDPTEAIVRPRPVHGGYPNAAVSVTVKEPEGGYKCEGCGYFNPDPIPTFYVLSKQCLQCAPKRSQPAPTPTPSDEINDRVISDPPGFKIKGTRYLQVARDNPEQPGKFVLQAASNDQQGSIWATAKEAGEFLNDYRAEIIRVLGPNVGLVKWPCNPVPGVAV